MEDVEIDDVEIDEDDVEFGGGMKIPREMYDNLFEYQKTGISLLNYFKMCWSE